MNHHLIFYSYVFIDLYVNLLCSIKHVFHIRWCNNSHYLLSLLHEMSIFCDKYIESWDALWRSDLPLCLNSLLESLKKDNPWFAMNFIEYCWTILQFLYFVAIEVEHRFFFWIMYSACYIYLLIMYLVLYMILTINTLFFLLFIFSSFYIFDPIIGTVLKQVGLTYI